MTINRHISEKMAFVAGCVFIKGSNRHYFEEGPAHEVEVQSFWINKTAVTNREFGLFVADTGYLTDAERGLRDGHIEQAPDVLVPPGSLVFHETDAPVSLNDPRNWWKFVPGACWHSPEGPGSTIVERSEEPVVHVSLRDAKAYAKWIGLRLPTEAEWECAAGWGYESLFPWGNDVDADDSHMMNIWRGGFPYDNRADDGFSSRAPVSSFPPNPLGCHNMLGNVWEWTVSKFEERHGSGPSCCIAHSDKDQQSQFVVKGGSYLCAPEYCRRYRPTARTGQFATESTCHIGFRCVWQPEEQV